MILTAVAMVTVANFGANSALGQFYWEHWLNSSGSITTEVRGNTTVIVVNGTPASDRVEVNQLGAYAIVSLYSGIRLVAQKKVRALEKGIPVFPGYRSSLTRFDRKELWLQCELHGGNDHFECRSTNFDQIEVYGGSGNDVIFAGPAFTFVYGGDDNDTIIGSEQIVTGLYRDHSALLLGEAGNDIVIGGRGDEWIVGGDGTDYLVSTRDFETDGADTVIPGFWWDSGTSDDGSTDYIWADSTDEVRIRGEDRATILAVQN